MPTTTTPWFQVMPRGIRAKLTWAFILMSCVPLGVLLLVAAWFVFPYTRELFPQLANFVLDPKTNPTETTWWIWTVIVLTIAIALLGSLYLTIKIVEPVLRISREAARLATDPTAEAPVTEQEGELGDLSHALNQMTSRLRDNMKELKDVGERTSELNAQIHQRMFTLSSLLQVGELIGNGMELETVLDLIIEKLAKLGGGMFSFLCLQPEEGLRIAPRRAHRVDLKRLNALTPTAAAVIIDAAHPPAEAMRALWEELGKADLLMYPVMVRRRVIGMLALGTYAPQQAFSPEMVDTVSVFAKQVSIALENELLLRKNKALTVKDELTGLYNETYIRQRLNEEIQRAILYQRPCALALFIVEGLARVAGRQGQPGADRALKTIARVIQDSVTEIDRVGRMDGDRFAVILPERNKRQAMEIFEEIRRRVAAAFAQLSDPGDRLSVFGSVAENPLDGVTAEDLLSKSSASASGGSGRPQEGATA